MTRKTGLYLTGFLCVLTILAGCSLFGDDPLPEPGPFVAVESINGVPTAGLKGEVLDLGSVSVRPSNATRQTIAWTIMDSGTTGIAAIVEGRCTPANAGTLEIRAEISGGLAGGALFVQDFTITITSEFVPVGAIAGVPATGIPGRELDLSAARVIPAGASRQSIAWTVADSGGTGVTAITGAKALPAKAGTLVLRASITQGKSLTEAYAQDFSIVIAPASGNTEGEIPEDEDLEDDTPIPVLMGIEIASSPNLTLYARNQPFDPAGLGVNKVYDNGSVEALASGYSVSPVDTTVAGTKEVYVSWGSFYAGFTVYVDNSELILTDMAMTKGPNKTAYYLGENFSKSGVVIAGTYSDGSTKTFDGGSAGVRGYDRYMRGKQTVTLTVNNRSFPVEVTVKVPSRAVVSLNPDKAGSANHQAAYYKATYIKGAAFEFDQSNLQARVTLDGVSLTFIPGRGLYPEDVQGFNPDQPGLKQLTLGLDEKNMPFTVYVANVDPAVWFDYGYMRTAEDPEGIGPGAGKYYAQAGETLVLAPVRYLIGYNADHSPGPVSYSWSVSGGAWDSGVSTGGETFAFTPQAVGTYTVEVAVTGRNYATGQNDTITASTEVVCYSGTVAASKTFTPPLKNFAPGQFTQSGNGYGWSLGAAGGYEVWAVQSHQDYMITGNPMATWSEPGIVWVMEDRNNNGIPDEMWYELTGSDETNSYKDRITRRYAITYLTSGDTASVNEYGQTIAGALWVDSKGRTGLMYGGWPGDWGVTGPRVTYTGTLLRDTGEIATGSYAGLGNMGGYVDSFGYGKWASAETWNKFYVSDAIRADGSPAGSLNGVRFIKVQSAVLHYGGVFGEVSTEIQSGDYLGSQSNFPSPAGGR